MTASIYREADGTAATITMDAIMMTMIKCPPGRPPVPAVHPAFNGSRQPGAAPEKISRARCTITAGQNLTRDSPVPQMRIPGCINPGMSIAG